MDGITFKYPVSGEVSLSVDLPWPTLSIPIKIDSNQKEYRAAAGNLWTCKVGPTIYQIQRVYESLTEQQAADLFIFLEAIGFFGRFRYCYYDSSNERDIEVPVRIIDNPIERVASIGIRDVTIATMQYKHPDNETEFFYRTVDKLITDEGDTLIDSDGNVLTWGT